MQQEAIPNTYWQAVKDRMGELAAMPGNAVRGQMRQIGQGAIMNPNARPGVPMEAMPGDIDPVQRQKLIEAIAQRQQGAQPPPGPDPQADQQQMLLEEAKRRGIQF